MNFRLSPIVNTFLAALLLLITGCYKNETAIEEQSFTNLSIRVITIDSLRLKVMANETLLSDSLVTPDGSISTLVQYTDPLHRIQLLDVFAGDRALFDSMIAYKPGSTNNLTFFQSSAGADIIFLTPAASEPLPPAENVKLSILYTYSVLPDSVKVVVENSSAGANDYAATDSFLLKKGEMSKFFLSLVARKAKLKLFTAGTNRNQVAAISESTFAGANPDFSIYLFRTGNTVNPPTLSGEKIY